SNTVDAETAPVSASVTGDVTVSCAGDVPAANNTTVVATDNCSGPVTVTSNDVVTPGACANRYSIARTYTATDACGNTSSKTQTKIGRESCRAGVKSVAADITVNR